VTSPEELTGEAVRLIAHAAQESLVLRALGSIGVALHCDPASAELTRAGRGPKDIDLVTRKRDRQALRRLLESHGYEADRDMLVAMEGTRYLFRHPGTDIDIDVWVDALDFCHRLDVGDRMGSGPSLEVEDLLLSKLQIVELTANDRLDLAAILAVHDIGGSTDDPEVIDADYVAGVLADDWGFWRTATGNLAAIASGLPAVANARAEDLASRIDAAPKTLRWRLRSKVGERVQWWQDVDIPRDTY
jgi:hypothetical protein